MNQPPPDYSQPYFESAADYQFRLIDPDSKTLFKSFKEINKDLVTANLNGHEIEVIIAGDSLIGSCSMCEPFLDDFSENIARDLMIISNASKARGGFLFKRVTEQRLITNALKKKQAENNVGD